MAGLALSGATVERAKDRTQPLVLERINFQIAAWPSREELHLGDNFADLPHEPSGAPNKPLSSMGKRSKP